MAQFLLDVTVLTDTFVSVLRAQARARALFFLFFVEKSLQVLELLVSDFECGSLPLVFHRKLLFQRVDGVHVCLPR